MTALARATGMVRVARPTSRISLGSLVRMRVMPASQAMRRAVSPLMAAPDESRAEPPRSARRVVRSRVIRVWLVPTRSVDGVWVCSR